VWVAANGSQQIEAVSALSEVARWGIPILLVLNCREDLSTDRAIEQFLAYPDGAFSGLDGHLARLSQFMHPHLQRPLEVLPIHAAAALLGNRPCSERDGLVRASRIDSLRAAVEEQADRLRPQRRAVAILDTARRALVDATEEFAAAYKVLGLVSETMQRQEVDFDQRSRRLIDDASLHVHGEIEELLRRFDDWAERHYQSNDDELERSWESDERHLRMDAAELLAQTELRLRRRLVELDEQVAAAWAHRLEVNLVQRHQIAASSLNPRWLDAAGGVLPGTGGAFLGAVIGGFFGNAPGVVIGSMIGGAIGDRLGSLLQFRRRQLRRRRDSLRQSVREALNETQSDIAAEWQARQGAIRTALHERASQRERAIEHTGSLASHVGIAADSSAAAIAATDTYLLEILLRLEGRERLAQAVGSVKRRPGFACVVLVNDALALREFALWPPEHPIEQLRPVLESEQSPVRRATYALSAGRRRIVLVPDGAGVYAMIAESPSPEFLAAETEFVSMAVGVSIRHFSDDQAKDAT
jgi:hypothetical protein